MPGPSPGPGGPAGIRHAGGIASIPHALQQRNLLISGLTLDAAGAAVGSVIVDLFDTPTNTLRATTTSDASTGAYSFPLSDRYTNFYLQAYKLGPPTVYFGTTANTLVAV